ncbi:unnamed protein product [Rotaria sordida]|uniref:DUF4371 domain-containing protein n=1 Tax=Rotaria sordida TaxID=392033 RepID=A0A814UHA1_9BILA|nr:unnamed protein product [Rotaria sordida]
MSKKHKDISTYFVSNKRPRSDVSENNSEISTAPHFYNTNNNNSSEIIDNEAISVTVSSLSASQNHGITIDILTHEDDIGLYVSNNTAKNDFPLLNRLLTKPWIPPPNYIFPKTEENEKKDQGNDKDEFLNDNNINPGNFKSLVLFTAEAGDQALQKHLNHHQKNATYLSWQTQNELINICARLIKNKLLNELITTQKFYAIIADETSDLSGTEQLSISIRFVSDENDILIKEIFLGFEALSDTTAVGIAKAIATFIQTSDLKIEKIRGQGYDGANVVAGKLGGVQKLIKDIVPRANYFHCSNHSLDLVLAEACTLQLIKMFFGVIKSVINFINASPNRKRILAKAIESTNNETKRRHFVKLCETRWVDKQTSIIVFKQVFFDVIIALDYLAENGDSETSGLVRSYGKALTDIDFVIPLIIVNRVFCITKPYAEQFQKPTCDLLKCFQSIEQALTYLAQLIYDDNELNELYNELTKFVELHEIDNCLSRTTSRRYEFVKNYFTDVYRTFINTTIEELGRRFNEHQKIAMHISNLIPSYFVNTQFSNVLPLFHCYKDDLLSDDPNIHKAEFDRWKFSILQMKENERPSTIIEALKIMKPIKSFYPNIYIFYYKSMHLFLYRWQVQNDHFQFSN